MNILILDPYKKEKYRISKDTSGGYGTGNNFGNSLFTNLLKKTFKKAHDWPPMFAVYTHSVLTSKGYKVDFRNKLPENFDNYNLFIVTSSIVCCETEVETIKKLKNKEKKIFVIGPFATNQPKKYIDAGATVVIGEPEFYFLGRKNFIEDLKKKSVSFLNNFNLDDLPLPIWNQINSNISNKSLLFGGKKTLPIIATRGCPYSCFKYCVYPLQQGRKVRQRDPIKIVDEMEFFNKNQNVDMFIFRDPVFSINRKHTIEFANELIKRNLKIKYVIETHLRIMDTELIQILKKSGLKGVKVGVESADKNVLNQANRFTIEKDDQYSKIRELEKNNIQVSSMFILGFPEDNETSMMSTINYAKKLNTTYGQFSVWTPYPGTPVYDEYKNKILAKNYEDYDQYNLVYKHKILSPKKVRNFLEKAYESFYLRPSWILKYLKSFLNA